MKFVALFFAVVAVTLYIQSTITEQAEAEKVAAIKKAKELDEKRMALMTPQQRAAEEYAAESARLDPAVRGACMIAIKQSLHDPDSARFEPAAFVERIDKDQWKVQRHLRATNGFGALRYQVIECKIIKSANDTLTVTSLHQIR